MKLFFSVVICGIPILGILFIFYKCISDIEIYNSWQYLVLLNVISSIICMGGF